MRPTLRYVSFAALACLAGLALVHVGRAASPARAQVSTLDAPAIPRSRAEIAYSFAPVVKKAQPAVVNVFASRVERMPANPFLDDPIFRRFFGEGGGGMPGRPNTAQSLGSGVIVDPAGLVVTNNHVIEGMTDVKIALADKREIPAKILLRDPRTDLAVLKLTEGSGFPTMELGDSDALEVGDLTLAIGNPFGVGQTVTQGIVSALARTHVGISDYGFFIQTDAAINPGNSGGPLVDMNARVVGINSAIFSKSGGSVGIGFAIPVNMVKSVLAAAKGGGKTVKRPWLGATLQTISQEIAEGLGLERPTGALLADIDPKGPAADAGLKRGDVIVSVDGQTADDPESVGFRLGTKPLGGQATLGVLRGGKKIVAQMRLTPAPETPPRDAIKLKGQSPFAGATVVNISPAVVEEMSVQGTANGVVVSEIEDGSFAQQLNLQRGDVVLAVNDQKIESTRDLDKVASSRAYYWKITMARGGQVFTTVVGG
ncbi:Do family serine endopeptidase [Methylocystis parvus]|uniref:Do family serine endopeptidase n=1 Tax=Methylocystis parvus TaxID=134 RepID=A0A6B8MAL3_9HYPH|nr:Do family serine endopeptidase [Methylocystis parvus]QGM97690.1 Do family serine endopeptidase [Methylocystis parvus]WBJ98375.1 Do family serine endopeptidase [Methylocystis parvus OBBP]